jgi:hypothetical protein
LADLGLVVSDHATNRRTGDGVVTGHVPHDPAYRSAFEAAAGIGRAGKAAEAERHGNRD